MSSSVFTSSCVNSRRLIGQPLPLNRLSSLRCSSLRYSTEGRFVLVEDLKKGKAALDSVLWLNGKRSQVVQIALTIQHVRSILCVQSSPEGVKYLKVLRESNKW